MAVNAKDLGTYNGVTEAATKLGISRTTLYRLMDAGELNYVQRGPRARRQIPDRAIVDYLARHEVARSKPTKA